MPTPRKGYYVDGKRVPSVTTVCKAAGFMPTDVLCSWAARLAREGKDWKEVRNRAGFVGTAAHSAIEGFPNEPEYKPEYASEEWARIHGAWTAHGEWVARVRPQILLQEVQLVSKAMRCGGTPDLVVKVAGKGDNEQTILVDHKTSRFLGASVVLQVAAYAEMLREQMGIVVDGALVMHHPEDKPFCAVPLGPEALKRGLRGFILARELYDLGPQLERDIARPNVVDADGMETLS